MDLLLALLLTFGLMWLLLIRPQQRRMRAHQQVVSSLAPGDDVVTAGGIHGVVTGVDTDDVRVEIAPGVVIRVLRSAISQRTSPLEDEDDEEVDEVDEDEEVDEINEIDEVDGVHEVVEDEEETDKVEREGSRRTLEEDGA